jgi:DNA-binding winged helix-turn-helix (wHTH) protein
MALLTSRLKMDGNWAPHHVALMDGLAARRFQLRDRLEQGGCSPALFDNASELLALLCGGKRFNLMLIVEDGTPAWHQLVTVCGVFGIPALVLASACDVERGATWLQDFPGSPLFDYAFVDCQDVELRQRMKRLLDRGVEHQIQSSRRKGAVFGNYRFHEDLRAVSHRGREIDLQPRQFQLALELFRNAGTVLARSRLWALLWTTPFPAKGVRTLDVCVANVRKKLELSPENGFTLRSVYGLGYQLLAATPPREAIPEFASGARLSAGWPTHSSSSPPPDQASASPH